MLGYLLFQHITLASVDTCEVAQPTSTAGIVDGSTVVGIKPTFIALETQVARMAAILDKDMTDRRKTAEVDISTLVTASYLTLMGCELQKRTRRAAPAAFHRERPKALFGLEWLADADGWMV